MKFETAFLSFKAKYSSTPRVIKIMENDFGLDDITVLFYDKKDATPPLDMTSFEGYAVDVRGIMPLLKTWEDLWDIYVLNDPNTWEQEVPFAKNYKHIRKMITDYELGLLNSTSQK